MARRWRPGVGAMATAPRRYDRRDAMLSPPPRRRRRRCEDTARRLRVRLGIVVRDEDGGVAHVVDGRVVQLVLGRVAQVRRQRVFDPLAELAGHNADQEDRLAALGVGLAVERIRTIRGVAGEVNAFACVESFSESGATERHQRDFDFYTGSCQRNSRASRRRSG